MWVWMRHEETGGEQQFPAETVSLWQRRGWMPCADPSSGLLFELATDELTTPAEPEKQEEPETLAAEQPESAPSARKVKADG